MSTLKTKTIRSNLIKKGFSEVRDKDHIYLHYMVDNKKSRIFTKISHSASEIGDPLIALMARQTKLSKDSFKDFAECRLSGEEYFEKVKDEI